MSDLTSRIQNHRVWGLLEALGPSIDKALGVNPLDPAAAEALERLKLVLAFCGKRLGGIDPALVPPVVLDNLASTFESAKSEVDAFAEDKSMERLARANVQADLALTQIAQVPGLSTPQELINLIQVISSHRAELEQMTRTASEARVRLNTELEELKKSFEGFKINSQAGITEMTASIEAEKQKLATLAAQQQKLFSDAQESRANTYSETLLKIQESLSKTLTDQQGQFSGAQESRSRDFAAAQTESQKRFGDLVADYTKRLTDQDAEFKKQRDSYVSQAEARLGELQADYQAKAQAILDEVNKRRTEVESLVGVIGNTGVTSGYQATANQARNSMWLWQAVAVVAMTTLIVFAYRAFLPAMHGRFEWSGFATRVFLTVTVGVLAAYAVNQADKFFRMEKYNRRLALELAAIDPFIALLPPDEQYKFKLEIGRRSFAQEEIPMVRSEKSPATTIDVLLNSKQGEKVVDLLIELAKKLPKVS